MTYIRIRTCKFQADINTNVQDEQGAFYGVNSQYESSESMTITCSTKVCSFGKQVVEKVEVSKFCVTFYASSLRGRHLDLPLSVCPNNYNFCD